MTGGGRPLEDRACRTGELPEGAVAGLVALGHLDPEVLGAVEDLAARTGPTSGRWRRIAGAARAERAGLDPVPATSTSPAEGPPGLRAGIRDVLGRGRLTVDDVDRLWELARRALDAHPDPDRGRRVAAMALLPVAPLRSAAWCLPRRGPSELRTAVVGTMALFRSGHRRAAHRLATATLDRLGPPPADPVSARIRAAETRPALEAAIAVAAADGDWEAVCAAVARWLGEDPPGPGALARRARDLGGPGALWWAVLGAGDAVVSVAVTADGCPRGRVVAAASVRNVVAATARHLPAVRPGENLRTAWARAAMSGPLERPRLEALLSAVGGAGTVVGFWDGGIGRLPWGHLLAPRPLVVDVGRVRPSAVGPAAGPMVRVPSPSAARPDRAPGDGPDRGPHPGTAGVPPGGEGPGVTVFVGHLDPREWSGTEPPVRGTGGGVVLVACCGAGDPLPALGWYGPARRLLETGEPWVIASRWAVPEDGAERVADDLVRALEGSPSGRPHPAGALARVRTGTGDDPTNPWMGFDVLA